MLLAILIFLVISATITMIAAAGPEAERPGAGQIVGGTTLAVLVVTIIMAVIGWSSTGSVYGVLNAGPLSSLGTIVLAVIGMLVTGGVMANPDKYRTGPGEFFGFILFMVIGGILMLSTNNLLVLYLGIELSSYSTYILVGYYRDDRYSNEAASKYFLLGAVASAFLLFGMSLVYAGSGFPAQQLAGSLDYTTIANNFAGALQTSTPLSPLLWLGIAFLLVGFGFKLALVPFHAWTPDAYQGAPSMVAALLSVGPKAATIIALVNLLNTAFVHPQIMQAWQTALLWLAALSMTVGNLQAIQQRNVKRLLGFSSVAQLGYVVIGVATGTLAGTSALIFYIIGYSFTNIGAFAAIAALREAGVGEEIEDYAGLVKRSPLAAVLLGGFFMSLAGVPLLAGFLGKLFIFKSAVDAGLLLITIVAVINTVIAYFYYFRVVVATFLLEPKDPTPVNLNPTAVTVLASGLACAVLLGVYPTGVVNAIDAAVKPTAPPVVSSR
jgi:NADH-quinone oxidoreductase subunit N